MTRMLVAFLFTLLMLVLAAPIFGDIARPNSTERQGKMLIHSGIEIVPDTKAYEARLELPPELFKDVSAALIDVPERSTIAQKISHSSPRTIIAGLFLFLSVGFAGVWLARSGQRNQRIAAAIVLGAAVLGAATIITNANAGPPGYVRWQGLPQALNEGKTTRGGVDVVLVKEGSGIRLIVPLRKSSKTGEE